MSEKKYIKALDIKEMCHIQPGHTIKIYGEETTVTGFYGQYNEGLEKWETIILTERRGDPFERSLDVIEVLPDQPYTVQSPPVAHLHKETVEENWELFWKGIVCNEDGTINVEQIKKELADFSFIMEQVPKVYCHITGSRMSKVMYHADTVISVADDYFNEQLEEAVKVEMGEPGAAWIKASDRLPGYETPVKWRDGKDHSHATDGKIPLIHMAKPFLSGWEWYDEGTAAGREDDAVAFAEWAIRNATVTSTYDGWIYGSKRYTTAELYDIFKQQKEK